MAYFSVIIIEPNIDTNFSKLRDLEILCERAPKMISPPIKTRKTRALLKVAIWCDHAAEWQILQNGRRVIC